MLTGDVDGDGRTDLIWNFFSAAGNHVLVALARPK